MDWLGETMSAENITRLEQVRELSEQEHAELRPVEQHFVFRSNSYYQGLINWNDPHDPIRRLTILTIQFADW